MSIYLAGVFNSYWSRTFGGRSFPC